MRTITLLMLAALLLGACTEIAVESPGCSASASAGGGGGGGGAEAEAGGAGAEGGGANSQAGCTPGKTTVAEGRLTQ